MQQQNRFAKYASDPIVKPADPTAPLKVPQAEADLTGKGLGNAKTREELRDVPIERQGKILGNQRTEQQMGDSRLETYLGARKQFDGDLRVQRYRQSKPHGEAAWTAPDNAAGDLSIIYSFGQVMDPGSVVREGEQLMVRDTSPYADKLKMWIGRVKSGNRAFADQNARKDVLGAIQGKVDAYYGEVKPVHAQFSALLKNGGVADPESILGPIDIAPNFAQAPVASFEGRSVTERDAAVSKQLDTFIRTDVPFKQANEWAVGLGFSPINPQEYAKAQAYVRENPGYNKPLGTATKTRRLGMVEKGLDSIARSEVGTGLAQYANATAAGLPRIMAGSQGDAAIGAMEALHPDASVIGKTGGIISGALLSGVAAPKLMPGLSPGKAAAIGDTTFGATFGASETPDNRMQGAALGGGTALAGHGAGRYVAAPLLGAARRSGVGQRMFGAVDLPNAAEAGVYNAVKPEFEQIAANIADARAQGLPYTLADASPATRNLGGTAARVSPQMRAQAEQFLAPRAYGQIDRLVEGASKLAPPVNMAETGGAIKQQAQAASKPYYDAAMARPSVDDPVINDLLRTPAGEGAIHKGYNIELNNGANPADLSITMGIDGQPILNGVPNWQTLQSAKRGLDSSMKGFRNPLTGQVDLSDPAAASVDSVRAKLNARMGELNPDYAKANSVYSENIAPRDALNRGYSAFATGVTPDTMAAGLNGMKPTELARYRQGFATRMVDDANKSKFAVDPYKAVAGSPQQLQKLRMAFPAADEFLARVRLENDMSATTRETIGGSPTQARSMADQDYVGNAGVIADGISMATTGTPIGSSMFAAGGRKLQDLVAGGFRGRAVAKANEQGAMLFDPKFSVEDLQQTLSRGESLDQYIDRMRRLGSRLGATGALAAPYAGQ